MEKTEIDYRVLFESSPVPRFLVCYEDGGASLCDVVNDKSLEFFGLNRADFSGTSFDSLLNEADVDVFLSTLKQACDKRAPVTVKLLVKNSSDAVLFVVDPFVSAEGNIKLLDITVLSDCVSEEDIVQRERDDAISLLTSVFDVSEVGIIVTDRHQRVIRINDSFSRIYGWARDQIIGHEFVEFIIPEEREIARKRHAEFMKSGIRSSGEMKILRKNDSVAHALFTTAALELSHGRQFQITTIMDITMRKKMEESLRIAKEQADAASKAKSSFLANMSHELRTPLNAVIGFSEMMVAETFGPLGSEKYKEYLNDIHLSAEHLLEVINEVLDMSKIEAGRVELVEERVDVKELISSVSRMMASRAFSGGVELKETVPDGLPALYGDHRLLRQILINLVSNSIKFSSEDTVVETEAQLLETGELVLKVSDQGIGIPEDRIDEALEPFGQIDRASQYTGYQGTGLGLPLARAMVELHGGKFQVISEEDQGTTVICQFPVSRVVFSDDKSDRSPLSNFKKTL